MTKMIKYLFILLFTLGFTSPALWCQAEKTEVLKENSLLQYLPNIWSASQVLRFSGLDGSTQWDTRFWAETTDNPYEFVFYSWRKKPFMSFIMKLPSSPVLDYFIGDALSAHSDDSAIKLVFWKQQCLVGYCTGGAEMDVFIHSGNGKKPFQPDQPVQIVSGTGVSAGVSYQEYFVYKKMKLGNGFRWAIAYDRDDPKRAAHLAEAGLNQRIDRLAEDKINRLLDTTFDLSQCSPDEVKTALKAVSVLRGAYKAPEGQFVTFWSNPSPWHVHLNVWDTLFHCFGTRYIDPVLAEQDALSLLRAQRQDGFIGNPQRPPQPHHDARGIHPPLIGWALWNLYLSDHNMGIIREAYPRLARFIQWIRTNKDKNNNLLLEWRHTDGNESGRDNGVRFDKHELFDAVDFTGFVASEIYYLALMAEELGLEEESRQWKEEHEKIKKTTNELLWDPTDEFYYGRYFNGELNKIKTNASFVSLFGSIATPARAKILIEKHLLNSDEFWTEMPVPSVSIDEALYEDDMWRGPVWLCYNHLIIDGLVKYGYQKEAFLIMQKSLDATVQIYQKTGNLYEFYDAQNKIVPAKLNRKGKQIGPRTEYSWTAAEILYLINGIYEIN